MTLLLNTHNLCKSLGAKTLFKDLSFSIKEKEKIGLIGPNGSGKSTLLKILCGKIDTDDGTISKQKGTSIGYVPQLKNFPDNKPAIEYLIKNANIFSSEEEKLLQATIIMTQCGFEDHQVKPQELSGGWQKRLSIAIELINNPTLLLLDEPTNHLDVEGILWLEKQLNKYSGAVLMISHDRLFLDRTVKKVMEINPVFPDGYISFSGDYSTFLNKKREFLLSQEKLLESLKSKAKVEKHWLSKTPQARTTKSKYRTEEAYALFHGLQEIQDRTRKSSTEISFSESQRSSKKLVQIEQVSKSFNERVILSNLSLTLSPGRRLGVLGPNGSGKSTFLKLIDQKISPNSGSLRFADNLKLVYFEQNRSSLNSDKTVRDILCPAGGDYVKYKDKHIHIASYARRFQFDNIQLQQKAGQLSGGEQARLLIAQLMLQEADILMLDEPTNDLDIETLNALEDSLKEFTGALILITHDRYFLDQVSELILALDTQGHHEFFADYSQWESWFLNQSKQTKETTTGTEKQLSLTNNKKKAKAPKMTYKEKQEWEQMEEKILLAEESLQKWKTKTENTEILASPDKLQDSFAKMAQAQIQVDQLYTKWAELEKKRP